MDAAELLEKAVPATGQIHLHECIYHDRKFICMDEVCKKIPDWTGKRMIVELYGVCPHCRELWG